MAIAFTQIPANLLVPGQYQEIDNSLAGAQGDIKTVLAIGMKAKTAKAPAGVPVNVVSAAQAKEAFGFGSPAAIMADAFLASNKTEKLYVLPVDEPQAGTAWKKEYTVKAASAGDGSVMLTINGRGVWAAVKAGMDAAKIAAAVVAACNGLENSSVQAETSGDSGKIIFSSIYKGSAGNKNTLKIESLAAGVTRGRCVRSFIDTTEFRPLQVCLAQTCGKRVACKTGMSKQTEYDNEFGLPKLGRTAGTVCAFLYRFCSPQWRRRQKSTARTSALFREEKTVRFRAYGLPDLPHPPAAYWRTTRARTPMM